MFLIDNISYHAQTSSDCTGYLGHLGQSIPSSESGDLPWWSSWTF